MHAELQNLILRAEALVKTNWIHAVNLLEKAAEDHPQEKAVMISLGDIYVRRQQHRKAIAEYQKALAIDPTDEQLCFLIGNCFFALHEYRLALSFFDKIKESSADVLYNKSLVLAYLGNHTESIEMIKQTIRIVPDNPFIYFLLIEQLVRTGRFDEALDFIKKGEEKLGKHKHLTLLKAVVYTKLGIWLMAFAAFMDYEKLSSIVHADHFHAYGVCAFKIGQFTKAAELLNKALLLEPGVGVYYEDLMRLYLQQKEYDKAKEIFAMAKQNLRKGSSLLDLLYQRALRESDID